MNARGESKRVGSSQRVASSAEELESAWLKHVASTSAEASLPGLAAGTCLHGGRYVVQQELGRGGMGVVYSAWDDERRERVALKTLTRGSPTSIYRIKQEFRSLAHVVHRNLVRLHELFEDEGRWCFTMELVPGQTLFRALLGASIEQIKSALAELACGVSVLHGAGKLHRDLKPSNVMLTPERRVVILDFGLAEDIGGDKRLGSATALALSGTPGYMAPELTAASGASRASDWYSFGVVAWELLTERSSPAGSIPPPQATCVPLRRGESIPAELSELCLALLSPDPAARPDAAAVLRCLRADSSRADSEPASSLRALLGRNQELDWLRSGYTATGSGDKPVALLLSGKSGIGKTALVQAFMAERREALWLTGRCYEREFVPYKAFDAAVDELCRYLSELPAAELDALLPDDFAALCRLFPVLGRLRQTVALAGVTSEDTHELRRRGFEALGQLFARVCEQRPVVLYIDDLQWTDMDSMRLLLHVFRQAGAPKILLIASHRSDPDAEQPMLSALYDALANDVRLDVRTLVLGPLAHDAATALLQSVNPGAPGALVERAQGHPFLLEELSRYAARRALGADGWPTLEQALGSRIDALGAEERRLLELLALAGRPLSDTIARRAAGPHWHAALRALCAARLARRNGADDSSSCYHDAVREVARSAVPEARARRLHRALALGLLRSAALQPEQLALHLTGSGHRQAAAWQTVIAARHASESLAFERSAQLYEDALELGRFSTDERRELELARADALASAGRGSEAAELYVKQVEGGAPGDATELHMRAAEQYLLSGRLERGLELLRAALAPHGLHLPNTAPGAIASFVYHRARLRLRGYQFMARPVTAAAARRLALLQRAMVALARLDPLRASDLAQRGLLLALESGSATAISAGLVGDLLVGALFRVSEAEFRRRLERAEQACARFGGAQDRALLHSSLATIARLQAQPDLPAALKHLDSFFEIHRQHVLPRASYERPWEQWAGAVVRCMLGELRQVAREVPARLDEGWARGDHCIIPLWAGGDALLSRLAVGDVAAAERDLSRAEAAWSSRSFTLQDLMLTIGASHVLRYTGKARATWELAERARQRLEKSPLRRMPNAVDVVQALRGHAALELAAEAASRSERRELLQLARRSLRAPDEEPNLAATFRSHLLSAALHYRLGDVERAERALQSAELHLSSIPLFAQAVRYRRGLLLGGSEGARCVADAEVFLAQNGAVDVARLVNLLLPGYTAPRS